MKKPIVFLFMFVMMGLVTQAQQSTSVDLRGKIRQFDLPIRNQGSRNTCSVYATTFLLEYETTKISNHLEPSFSVDYLNAVTDIAKGSTDDGDFFSNILNGYLKFGTVAEAQFSTNSTTYDPKNVPSETLQNAGKNNIKFVPVFIREIPATGDPWGITDDHINQITAQLDAGRPVAAGWRLASAIENVNVLGVDAWTKNVFTATNAGFFGHSMAIVGYAKGAGTTGGYFIIRNSGGASWGDKGYWYCTFDFAKENIADVFYFRPRLSGIRVKPPQLSNKPVPAYLRAAAMQRIIKITRPIINVPILKKN